VARAHNLRRASGLPTTRSRCSFSLARRLRTGTPAAEPAIPPARVVSGILEALICVQWRRCRADLSLCRSYRGWKRRQRNHRHHKLPHCRLPVGFLIVTDCSAQPSSVGVQKIKFAVNVRKNRPGVRVAVRLYLCSGSGGCAALAPGPAPNPYQMANRDGVDFRRQAKFKGAAYGWAVNLGNCKTARQHGGASWDPGSRPLPSLRLQRSLSLLKKLPSRARNRVRLLSGSPPLRQENSIPRSWEKLAWLPISLRSALIVCTWSAVTRGRPAT
jgi:hypothetical protein